MIHLGLAVFWIGAGLLVFHQSRIAAIIIAIVAGLDWIGFFFALATGHIRLGVVFLFVFTGAVGWAVPASFAYHRLKRAEMD